MIPDAPALALRLAPELGDQPLYLVDARQAEAAGVFRPCSYGIALMGWAIPPAVKDVLGPEYRGPGRLIALDYEAITRDFPDAPELVARSIFLHEIAHLLPARPVAELTDSLEIRAEFAAQFAAWHDAPHPPFGDPADSHDLGFMRRLVHLHHRAEAAGWEVPYRACFSGPIGLTYPAYRDLLRAEAEALQGATFDQIEATPSPPELLALWQDDLEFQACLGKQAARIGSADSAAATPAADSNQPITAAVLRL